MKDKIKVFCDLNLKKWLNLEEAIKYVGYGSKDTFQSWREGIKRGKKTIFLKYHKVGKNIVYKRIDIDNFLEEFKSY